MDEYHDLPAHLRGYMEPKPPRPSMDITAKGILMAIIGIAALIYIGQFVWSFKIAADQREAAEIEAAQKVIDEVLARAARKNGLVFE